MSWNIIISLCATCISAIILVFVIYEHIKKWKSQILREGIEKGQKEKTLENFLTDKLNTDETET